MGNHTQSPETTPPPTVVVLMSSHFRPQTMIQKKRGTQTSCSHKLLGCKCQT